MSEETTRVTKKEWRFLEVQDRAALLRDLTLVVMMRSGQKKLGLKETLNQYLAIAQQVEGAITEEVVYKPRKPRALAVTEDGIATSDDLRPSRRRTLS